MQLPSDQAASGRTLGSEELANLAEVIESGTLTSTKGHFVKDLERDFAATMGSAFAVACASGSAAVHLAVAAIDPEPGDEIITTPITDIGGVTPILFHGAIPVFADVDPITLNVAAETIAPHISDRTRAIIVTHLFGNPVEMDDIMDLAEKSGIPVIEDCAQAFCASDHGRNVGTIGAIGCFSFQQGKHITAGEGGMVVTDDAKYARRMRLFVDKAWGYGDKNPDHYFLALNYRMTELQGAVLVAQLKKLGTNIEARRRAARRFVDGLVGVQGLTLPTERPDTEHVYWRIAVRVDETIVAGGVSALAQALKELDIPAGPRYIQKPAFDCEVIRDQKTFGTSGWPFTLARTEAVEYGRDRYPGAYDGLAHILVFPLNERYQDSHIDAVVEAVAKAVAELAIV